MSMRFVDASLGARAQYLLVEEADSTAAPSGPLEIFDRNLTAPGYGPLF